ncbi:MAG: CGNR zinc finger domain-containing protein [Miltoncostaeaceae bacterium]
MTREVTQARDLPEDLALPLRSGADHWYWLGGSPAVDLVNTLRERWRRRVECLVDGADVAEWLRRAGLLGDDSGALIRPNAAHLARARDLREAIDRSLCAVVEGRPPGPGDIAVIDDVLALAPRPALRPGAAVPELVDRPPPDPVDAALGALALDAARILGTGLRSRLRICGADDCSARFLDTSPAGRRRWCSMAGCGNRSKVRRHRARGPTSSAPPSA